MTFAEQFNEKADILMERFRSMADGKTLVDLLAELNHATLDAVCSLIFHLTVFHTLI
jgi:hypothetical protein